MTVENPSHHQDNRPDLCSEDRARTDANDEVLGGWRNMYRASYQRQFASSTVLDCERRRDLQPVNLHMSEKTIENVNLDLLLFRKLVTGTLKEIIREESLQFAENM